MHSPDSYCAPVPTRWKNSVPLHTETRCDLLSFGHQKCTASLTSNSCDCILVFVAGIFSSMQLTGSSPGDKGSCGNLGRWVTTTLPVTTQARNYIRCSRTDTYSFYLQMKYDSGSNSIYYGWKTGCMGSIAVSWYSESWYFFLFFPPTAPRAEWVSCHCITNVLQLLTTDVPFPCVLPSLTVCLLE